MLNICSLSVIIPCFNEEATLERCIACLSEAFQSASDVSLEIIIVDDCSKDSSWEIATRLAASDNRIITLQHPQNLGKGAALKSGFERATSDFVAIQDADLEYDPADLIRLLGPLRTGKADVVYGSRFLSGGMHRVLYFWHAMGNKFLTQLSNMFTDLNLTDMETCYKVFKREVIQNIEIRENRFGFEPEVTAKIAEQRLRVYEMGISYFGRTYEEGKKIGVRDGFRALYCIIKYNAHRAPAGLQFLVYVLIGGIAAVVNLALFLALLDVNVGFYVAAWSAFITAALVNYALCVLLLFKHKAQWSAPGEVVAYFSVVMAIGAVDVLATRALISLGFSAAVSKVLSSCAGIVLNFLGRKFMVFKEEKRGPWKPSSVESKA